MATVNSITTEQIPFSKDIKPEIQVIEDTATLSPTNILDGTRVAALKGDGLVKSRFDELSVWHNVWLFRKAALYCFFVYTGSLLEFYEVSLCLVHRPCELTGWN